MNQAESILYLTQLLVNQAKAASRESELSFVVAEDSLLSRHRRGSPLVPSSPRAPVSAIVDPPSAAISPILLCRPIIDPPPPPSNQAASLIPSSPRPPPGSVLPSSRPPRLAPAATKGSSAVISPRPRRRHLAEPPPLILSSSIVSLLILLPPRAPPLPSCLRLQCRHLAEASCAALPLILLRRRSRQVRSDERNRYFFTFLY
ncbi:hypothetical protein GUJ93_ZPchr0628g40553 [Zizania palustris]|uniref:Uncharacterized protein n=1 Tax=Zizania palustris TaxID=103762 RepID=A0A8J5SVX4_ZIZPA|nr:hypothetical protein GUJ93_ZPchr0628g40553 [Zizania palustris]